MNTSELYCAIIGDIVKSRKLKNRNEVQKKLKEVLRQINEEYAELIVADFDIMRGDGCQGLLKSSEKSYDIIKKIQRLISPIELVFGVGIGIIDTVLDSESEKIDGPAYHHALQMVEKAKRKKPSICYHIDSKETEMINAIIWFIESCEGRRTKKQKEAIALYNELDDQVQVAKKLKVEQSTVSRLLSNGFFHEITNAEDSINTYLKNLMNLDK